MNAINKFFYFNLDFVHGTTFNIREQLQAIYVVEGDNKPYEISLVFLLDKNANQKTLDSILIIAQEFDDALLCSYNPIKINYDYKIIYDIPVELDTTYCLFAWYKQIQNYNFINFFNYDELIHMVHEDKIKATLTQLLVGRIIPTTRIIRCLYDKVEKHLIITFIHQEYKYQEQLSLIEDLLSIFSDIVSVTYDIIHIQFDGNLLENPTPIRKNEWSLFLKYDYIYQCASDVDSSII